MEHAFKIVFRLYISQPFLLIDWLVLSLSLSFESYISIEFISTNNFILFFLFFIFSKVYYSSDFFFFF